MDERDMESMKAVMALLKRIDPEWKTALAGNYHPEIAIDIFDYCIIIHGKFDQDILKDTEGRRQTKYILYCMRGKPSQYVYLLPSCREYLDKLVCSC